MFEMLKSMVLNFLKKNCKEDFYKIQLMKRKILWFSNLWIKILNECQGSILRKFTKQQQCNRWSNINVQQTLSLCSSRNVQVFSMIESIHFKILKG